MGLLNDYGMFGGRSGGAGPRSRFFSAPPTMPPPSYTPPAGGDSRQPVERGVPERIRLDTILADASNQPAETPVAVEMLGRAPGWVLGAPLSLGQTVGKAGGFDLFGFLGEVAQAIPFIPGVDRETGDWNWSLGGFLGQVGSGLLEPITLVNQAVNAANADAIRQAQAGDPNEPAPFNLASALFHEFEPFSEAETNSEFLARMGRLGWTPDEFADLAAGRDSWSFHDLNHRLSEDVWQDLAYNILLDPLTYTPFVATKGAAVARRAGQTFQASQVGQGTQAIANLLTGSQAALRARQGAGLATSLVRQGVLPAVYMPIRMASQAIRSGAAGAAQHATRWSVADAILTATRGETFRTAARVGTAPLRPLGAMTRHAFDVRGYVSGFRPNTAQEIASAAAAGRNAPSPFWRGMQGYASRSTALRGTEFMFEQTAEGIDVLLGDEEGENTALGGFTESLRELGHAMVREDPIGSNLTGMLVAGFLYPGIPIVSEAVGVGRSVARSGGAAKNSIKGVWDDISWRPYNAAAGDIPNAPAFMRLFADEDFTANRAARDRAMKQVTERLGGPDGVRRLWDAATTALVREQLIRNLPNEWRIRAVASTAARAEVSAGIYRRAREDLIRAGKLTDDDVMHAIMAMDEGTGGFDLARAAERANGASALAGGAMRWNGELAARNWVRFMAASQPVNNALIEKGHQVVAGIREYLPKETLVDMRAALMIVRQGKGKDAFVTAGDVQRMLRDHPQLIALDPQGYWKQFAIMDPSAPVKWNSVGRKLQNMEKSAPTWDEVMADVNAHEATAGPVTGMGEEPIRSGAVALDNGRIRYAHAAPGEARVAVSRMNPELGGGPGTYREARALRSHPFIAAFERYVGAVLHDSGVNVDQVHQTIGGWGDGAGRVFREPSVAITMGRAATLEETRLTAAMTARSAGQESSIFWVTGSRLDDLGVKPNAALGRITNISRRAQARLEEVIHRRYGDGYTFDDTAGEAIVYVPNARIADLIPDLEDTLREAGVKGTAGAEPAYVEYMGADDINTVLTGATDDVRLTRYNDSIDRALNDPDFDDTALAERLGGTAHRTFLTSTKGGRGGRDSVRHGTLTTEGLIRDGIRRTQAEDGSVIPGLEAENAALRQQLRDLTTVKREALTRAQVLYKTSTPGDFDPFYPIEAPANAPILPKRTGEDGQSYPVGTVRYAMEGRDTVEVLREVPTDSILWGQDTLTIERGQAAMRGELDQYGYGRAVLYGGRLVLKDGHHRLNEAIRRGEGTVKVWVGEARNQPDADIRSMLGERNNETTELPITEERMIDHPIDSDTFILEAFDNDLLTANEVLGRNAPTYPERPRSPFRSTDDYEAFNAQRLANKRTENLSEHTPEEMAASQVFMNETGDAGFMVSPDGDLQNVFNNSGTRGLGGEAVRHAIRMGARTLDAYDGFLPEFYAKHGFREVARMKFVDEYAPPGWDFEKQGRPDVVFMALTDGSKPYRRTKNYVDDWDAAKESSRQFAEQNGANDYAAELYRQETVARNRWETSIRRGLARGDLTREQADALGLNDSTVQPLPNEPLYHATSSVSGVMERGLKTRDELSGKTALGGGDENTISFTTDRSIAERIAETLIEARGVLRGEITPQDLYARAEAGGFADSFRRYATTFFSNQEAGDAAWARLLERTDLDDNTLMDVYKGFLAAQEHAGKGYNPLFFMTDTEALKNIDPADVGVVTARAVPGAQGTQMGSMAEWRTWSGDAVSIEGRRIDPKVQVKQRFAQAEEQVLFNRTLDAEIDDLFPMLRYDRSTGSLSPEDLDAMRPAYNYLMRNFGGAYDLKVAPEMAFPITEVVPASLKVSTLLGQWVREYGPASKVTAMVDWFRKPVDTGRQAKLARTAMYRQLVPRGATIKQVDTWVNEMSNMTGQFTIGPLRLKVFRDATALTPDWINKAAAKSFPEKVIEEVGSDNFHLVLDRAANRFIRDTMFPGLQGGRQQGGSRGRLQRLVAQGYYIFQTGDPTGEIRPRGQREQIPGLRRVAEGKRLMAKTIYPIFRFMLDPRWHAMNRFEYNILSGVRDGIWRPERRTGQFEKGRSATSGDPITDFGAITNQADLEQLPPGARRSANLSIDDALVDIESVGGGMLHNREAAGFIARLWQSRAIDDIEAVVNQFPEMDAGLRDLMRLFPDDDTRSIYEKINDFMYDADMKGVKSTITDEAKRLWGARVTEELEPMLNQIALRHQQTFDAVTQMLQGNPARNNLERIMNSYWLYWPISYQLKAGRWLTQVLTEGFAGHKTNFGGASWVAYMTEKHIERMASDPEYQQMMEDHEGLFLAATMMLPITPFDLGVSLNRGIRGIGGHLGWWEEYKRAQDPMTFAVWLAELGPLYSIQLAQQVWGETFGSRNGDAENERSGRVASGTAAPGFDSTVNAGTSPPSFGP